VIHLRIVSFALVTKLNYLYFTLQYSELSSTIPNSSLEDLQTDC